MASFSGSKQKEYPLRKRYFWSGWYSWSDIHQIIIVLRLQVHLIHIHHTKFLLADFTSTSGYSMFHDRQRELYKCTYYFITFRFDTNRWPVFKYGVAFLYCYEFLIKIINISIRPHKHTTAYETLLILYCC